MLDKSAKTMKDEHSEWLFCCAIANAGPLRIKYLIGPEARTAILWCCHLWNNSQKGTSKWHSCKSQDIRHRNQKPSLIVRASSQDGYAVRHADGAGTFEVEFEALAGKAPGKLSASKIAYIGTGSQRYTISLLNLSNCVICNFQSCLSFLCISMQGSHNCPICVLLQHKLADITVFNCTDRGLPFCCRWAGARRRRCCCSDWKHREGGKCSSPSQNCQGMLASTHKTDGLLSNDWFKAFACEIPREHQLLTRSVFSGSSHEKAQEEKHCQS